MGEHTPGPWSWDAYGWDLVAPGATVLLVQQDSNGYIVCKASEADKNLIAAAPDLLAACEAAVALMEDFEFKGTNPHELCTAAIAKARGETSDD